MKPISGSCKEFNIAKDMIEEAIFVGGFDMLIKNIEKYYSKESNFNCAEAMLHAANETYNLGLDPKAFKLAAGFGSGMNINGPCGALTGAVMALGALFVKDRAHESDRIKNLEKELFDKYKESMGDINCIPLKDKYRNDETRCIEVMRAAGEILDEIVERESKL